MEGKIIYFEKPGRENTDGALETAVNRAKELGIEQIVVATTHGETALRLKDLCRGSDIRILAVSISAAFGEEGWTMTPAERESLETAGIEVLTSTHALGDDVSEALDAASANRIVRMTLYRFGQGMKVAVEISLMAADAGFIDMEKELVAVAGTGKGADTAIVVRPAYPRNFKELEIREILAKPR